MPASSFSASLVLPALVLASLLASGVAAFTAPLVVFAVFPVLEWVVGERRDTRSDEDLARMAQSPAYTRLLHALAWMHFALLGLFLVRVQAGVQASGVSGLTLAGWIASMGTGCGAIAVNIAHELGHRRRSLDRRMALALLHSSFYPHFFVEHVRGHHVHVGTEADPVSAPRGMGLYRYFLRVFPGVWASAWRIAAEPLAREGRSTFSLHNELVRMFAIQVALFLTVALLCSPAAALAWCAAGALGAMLLETVDYVEHYGLRRRRDARGELEPVASRHSWNSDHLIGRLLLFELPRHSDHHAHAARPYQCLRSAPDAPRLPGGYPMMMVLSAVPPLWFRVMDPKVDALREQPNP